MDQVPLVTEQIDAGAKLAAEFENYKPLAAVFWIKGTEDGEWLLYLASDQIDDTNFHLAYGEVARLLRRPSGLWLDPHQVKVRGTDDPTVRDVLEIQRKYPGILPTRLGSRRLGELSVDGVYLYALPIAATN